MSTDPEFEARNRAMIETMGADAGLREQSLDWIRRTIPYEYAYHFTWMGVPIIQLPADILALQEIVWRVKPRAIVETGVARGGSMIFYSSLLELLGNDGIVIGVELALRPHNRQAIMSHPMAKRIQIVDGSSVAPETGAAVRERIAGRDPVLVILDSNHTTEHVLQELELYGAMVAKGSYLVVLDTIVEDMPAGTYPGKDYRKGDSPKLAVHQFLARNRRFEIDPEFDNKLLLSAAPNGFLRCIA